IFRRPKVAVRTGSDTLRIGVNARSGILGNYSIGGNFSDLARILLSKPDIAVRTGRNIIRSAITGRNRVLGNCSIGGNFSDLARYVVAVFDKPMVAVRDGRYTLWNAV